jgi:small subunit ribosomal protein S6
VVLSIEGNGAAITELERRFRVTDSILRFISIRVDEDLKRSEKIKAARQKKSSKQPPVPPMTDKLEQDSPSES